LARVLNGLLEEGVEEINLFDRQPSGAAAIVTAAANGLANSMMRRRYEMKN
jgi:hypothetical protein